MATAESRKILRIGVIQNGTIIEERLLRKREAVTVGSAFKNTFCISAPEIPQHVQLFDVKGGKYLLHFDKRMTGRVSVGQGVHTLKSLRENGKAVSKGKTWVIELDDRSRGKVELGDVIFLFQFITPPPARPAPQLPVALRGGALSFINNTVELSGMFGVALLLSMLTQVGFVTYLVLEVPPPPRPTGVSDLPDEIRMILTESEEQDDIEIPDLETTEVADANTESAVEQVEEVQEDTPEQRDRSEDEDRPPANREAQLEMARDRVRDVSVFGALTSSDEGIGDPMSQVFNMTDRRVSHVMRRQQALGENGLASRGGTIGSADPSSEGSTIDVEVGGSRARDRAENVEGASDRERVRVSANIRQSRTQTAGSGAMDADYLNRVLRQRVRDVRRCYERVLPDNPDLGGRVRLQFTITERGRVDDPRLLENEVGDQVGDCIIGRVRRWRFDAPDGGSVTVRKTFILSPAG